MESDKELVDLSLEHTERTEVSPPDLPWYFVFALTFASEMFAWAWLFCQAKFVEKIDAKLKATKWLAVSFGIILAGVVVGMCVGFFSVSIGNPKEVAKTLAEGTTGCFMLIAFLLCEIAAFDIRASLQNYYGRHLSGLMTFLFAPIYFQYHFDHGFCEHRASSSFGLC